MGWAESWSVYRAACSSASVIRVFESACQTAYGRISILNMMTNHRLQLLVPSDSGSLGAMHDVPILRLREEAVRQRVLHDSPDAALVEADGLGDVPVCCFAMKRNGCKDVETIQSPCVGRVVVL